MDQMVIGASQQRSAFEGNFLLVFFVEFSQKIKMLWVSINSAHSTLRVNLRLAQIL